MTTGTVAVLPIPYRDDTRPFAEPRIAAASNLEDEVELAFEEFLLVPRSRVLLRNGRPVCLGSRAFDLLHALLKAAGTLVAKDELVKQVWPSTFVDESNLRFQMACLRKALGDCRHVIKTVPGRGYIFTGRCRGADRRPGPSAADGCTARLQPPPGGSEQTNGAPDAARSDGRGGWGEGSMSLVREWVEGPADPAADAASAPLRRAESARVALLMPMLVLRGGRLAEASAEERLLLRGVASIDLSSLLDLLRPGLAQAHDEQAP
jgi:DNA-binding winged helix-turn-helix (wHTH) protein